MEQAGNKWDEVKVGKRVWKVVKRNLLKVLNDLMMKKSKTAGRTRIISEMFMADEDCGVEWLTSLCNLIVGWLDWAVDTTDLWITDEFVGGR